VVTRGGSDEDFDVDVEREYEEEDGLYGGERNKISLWMNVILGLCNSGKLKKMNNAFFKGKRRMMRVFLSIPMPFC